MTVAGKTQAVGHMEKINDCLMFAIASIRRNRLFCPAMGDSMRKIADLMDVRRFFRAGAGLAALAAALAASPAAAQNIDTTGSAVGDIQPWGVPDTATYGQTIVPTSGQTDLKSFTFFVQQLSGGSVQFKAYVYQWTGTNITGPALFASAEMASPTGAGLLPVTINTGNVHLTPGLTYALFLTTSGVTNLTSGLYRWRLATQSAYPAGTYIYENNGTDFSRLFSPWDCPDGCGALSSFIALFGPSFPNFLSFATTGSQFGVASGLVNAANANPNSPVVAALANVDAASGAAVLDQLSGAGIAATQNAGFQQSQQFGSTLNDAALFWLNGGNDTNGVTVGAPAAPLAYAAAPKRAKFPMAVRDAAVQPPTRTWRAWLTGFGGAGNFSGNRALGTAAQGTSYYGGAFGLDYQLLPSMLVGAAVGLSEGRFSVGSLSTSGSVSGVHVGGYTAATFGRSYAIGGATYSWLRNSTSRSVGGIGGVPVETDVASFRSEAVRVRTEVGHRFGLGGFGLTPFGGFELAHLTSDSFAERGWSATGPALFSLAYAAQSAYSAQSSLGARVERRFDLGGGMTLTPTASLAWTHEFVTRRQASAALIFLPGAAWQVEGARPSRDGARVKAGLDLALNGFASINAGFDGDFAGASRSYGGKGGLKIRW
jgi:outer membrane autotransporter protein